MISWWNLERREAQVVNCRTPFLSLPSLCFKWKRRVGENEPICTKWFISPFSMADNAPNNLWESSVLPPQPCLLLNNKPVHTWGYLIISANTKTWSRNPVKPVVWLELWTSSFVRFRNGASPSLLFSPSIHSPHHLYAPLGRNPLSINTPSLPRLQIGDVLIPLGTFLRLNKFVLL